MKNLNWKYTIGEILIVIIGISIAFSLNKCAENSKDSSLRKEYLINIRNDVQADRERLIVIEEELQKKIETTLKILPILGSDSNEKMQITRDIFSVAAISNFAANDATYQTLINSGDLKLITDFELKKAIQSHYSNYKIMMKDYERQEIIHKEYLGDYFINNVDYDAVRQGKFGFSDEKLLRNIIQSMNGSFGLKLKATQQGIQSCDNLLMKLPSGN
ncbi:DUF6090 family protein [Ulvibacter antarcticus]|uniref:Uncharacterized protein n=1 Tax=Ulvibacter antarcticus TaxID=442714 RepID=A0A3L9Z0Y9_9FLAO|nr:DUF6090 family protein [Ulvibacter antarcticus]RMA66523.1 hypothetical protein BXY75_0949 [Ulvibacter antarcticus]